MDYDPTYLTPIIFEASVIFIFIFIWIHTLIRWYNKRTSAAFKLMLTFGLFMLAMFISFWSQLNRRVINYALLPSEIADTFRLFYLIITPLANLSFYSFYLEIFQVSMRKIKMNKYFVGFTVLMIIVALVNIRTPTYDVIGNLLIIIQGFFLYLPNMIHSASTYKKIDESDEGRYAFLAIFIMCLFFMLTWVSFLFNAMWDSITLSFYGPIFYFAWGFILIAELSGYVGFIFPSKFRKLVKSRIKKPISQ